MASATLREIYSNTPLSATSSAHAPALTIDEFAFLEDDPDLAPFLAAPSAWRPRKERSLDAFL